MIRLINLIALIALIGSATAAYTVKYETILVAEKLRKREAELQRERDAVAILKAEWQLLNRPQRMQSLAAPLGAMQPLSMRQIVRATDIPQRGPEDDKIEDLLTGSIKLPPPGKAQSPQKTATPGATTPGAKPGTAGKAGTTARAANAGATTPGKAPARAALAKAQPPKGNGPVKLVPPANLGAAPAARANPAPAPQPVAQPSLVDRFKTLFR